jgi:uncharacterized tellurite resistance protein B-like protein
MNIFDLFSSKDKRAKLSHLKNLIVLTMADGKIEKSELASIAAVCSREDISDSDFKKCLENPESIEFIAPKDDKTRLRYLTDMVLLMMSDGNIDENEMVICKMTAEALGYRHEVIDAMILDIMADLSKKVKSQK